MTNQDIVFWAKFTMYQKDWKTESLCELVSESIDAYVKEKVEDMASDEDMAANAAIRILMRRCNGGK